jgi:hypothetical protein
MAGDRSTDLSARTEAVQDAQLNAAQRQSRFDPSRSALFEQMGFVVGAPRSGTTWLQQLLFVHPLITTGGESHLFCEGLPEIFGNFAYRDASSHLSSWVSEAELLTAARVFCDTVFAAQRDGTRPDARIVVEKTPAHMPGQSALQARIYPDAKYVHIIRDGRDAAASQNKLWGAIDGDYANAGRVASGWAAAVRDIRNQFGGFAYVELKYEDIVSDTPGALALIFEHLGLPYDDGLCQAAANFGKAPVNTAPSSADVGVRKHEGNVVAERAVARAAGDLLVELGYADAAEVRRLAALRNRETVSADVREAVTSSVETGKHAWTDARVRLRKRAKRRKLAPSHAVGKAISDGVETKDAGAVAAGLAPSVRFDGKATPAAQVAAALVDRFAGFQLTGRRTEPGFVQLTAIAPDGARVIIRAELKNKLASVIDIRT